MVVFSEEYIYHYISDFTRSQRIERLRHHLPQVPVNLLKKTFGKWEDERRKRSCVVLLHKVKKQNPMFSSKETLVQLTNTGQNL